MPHRLVLASGSAIRAQLLKQVHLPHDIVLPRIDETSVKEALRAEGALPRDVADTLAELKARKVSDKVPDALVLGCDQILEHDKTILSKPNSPGQAIEQLQALRDSVHILWSAAVIVEAGNPIWRHVGRVQLRMRALKDDYLEQYVARNWESIQHAVGGYKLEEEGARLFTRIEGDYFHVLGMPFLELLNFLALRGDLET
ncbi:MAG: nucleoside triphosphate pyrophosphatase [Pseudomonadota bacterium]